MSDAPLMPKATAVWLVENTSLTFDQIAEFCKLHPLEVKGIADGEVATGIKGYDPISTGQLTREEIAAGEQDPNHRLHLSTSKTRTPEFKKPRGARYTPLSRRHDRPNAVLWLLRNHPELKDAPNFIATFLIDGELPREGQMMKLAADKRSMRNLSIFENPNDMVVLPLRIELRTSPLPRECSTTELRQRPEADVAGLKGRPRAWTLRFYEKHFA